MPFSFRVDSETEAQIRRLASKTGWSKSHVVREAVAHYCLSQDASGAGGRASTPSAYDRLRTYIGVVDTGGKQYSKETHTKYRALLHRKRRDRRSR